ncbi:hypothetical protein CBS101457_003238 [Exobasidium rhododendri]|nr:hypothetical protein CBS101457_003238 [Exobasidium rhododendri]
MKFAEWSLCFLSLLPAVYSTPVPGGDSTSFRIDGSRRGQLRLEAPNESKAPRVPSFKHAGSVSPFGLADYVGSNLRSRRPAPIARYPGYRYDKKVTDSRSNSETLRLKWKSEPSSSSSQASSSMIVQKKAVQKNFWRDVIKKLTRRMFSGKGSDRKMTKTGSEISTSQGKPLDRKSTRGRKDKGKAVQMAVIEEETALLQSDKAVEKKYTKASTGKRPSKVTRGLV